MPAADGMVVVLWFPKWDTSLKWGIGSAAPAGLPGENRFIKLVAEVWQGFIYLGQCNAMNFSGYSNDCSHLIMLRTTLIHSYFSFFLGCFVQSCFCYACIVPQSTLMHLNRKTSLLNPWQNWDEVSQEGSSVLKAPWPEKQWKCLSFYQKAQC